MAAAQRSLTGSQRAVTHVLSLIGAVFGSEFEVQLKILFGLNCSL